MADDFIAIDVTGIEEISKKLAKLPDAVADEGTDEANKYLLNVLKTYPPYRYVSRKSAYGQTFVSDKQRKYVMARIREGSITPGRANRTQTFRAGWRIIGAGAKSIIANETPYGKYLMDDQGQARQPGLVGWKKISAITKERINAILKAFDGGVSRAIKHLGL